MDKELVQEYLRRFDQTFSLLKNGNEASVWCIDLSEEDLRQHQQDFADRMLQEGSLETDVFSSGALIFYGYRLGAVRLKGKNECFTRQGGYMDNAIWTYNLDEILDEETEDDNPDACASHIIEWITNPGSNTDVAEAVIGKMIIPLVKLGTYKQFASFVDINKLSSIPSNYNTFSWRIKDKRKKLIPYFNLDAKTHTERQIIESVVDHFEHCSADIVADELLYLFKNGEDPCALFVAKVFIYMSQMDSLEIESRNEIITSIENVDDVVYQEIDKSHIHVSHPKESGRQPSIFASQRSNIRELEMTIEELDLTFRSYNCLKRAGMNTVKDVVNRSPADLLKVRNLGKTNRDEVVERIHKLGLKLSGE